MAAGDDKTYTADELTAEVSKQVASALEQANARIVELEGSVEKSALDTAVAEATQELRDEVDAKQKELEAADAAKKTAEDALQAERDERETEKTAAQIETRRDEREKFVKELALFSDELIEKSKDRWAAMDDEAWEAQKAEYQEAADRKGIKPAPLPKERPTAVTATVEGGVEGERSTSAVRAVMELRHEGVNTRKITVN